MTTLRCMVFCISSLFTGNEYASFTFYWLGFGRRYIYIERVSFNAFKSFESSLRRWNWKSHIFHSDWIWPIKNELKIRNQFPHICLRHSNNRIHVNNADLIGRTIMQKILVIINIKLIGIELKWNNRHRIPCGLWHTLFGCICKPECAATHNKLWKVNYKIKLTVSAVNVNYTQIRLAQRRASGGGLLSYENSLDLGGYIQHRCRSIDNVEHTRNHFRELRVD